MVAFTLAVLLAIALWKPWTTNVEQSGQLVLGSSRTDTTPTDARGVASTAAVPSPTPTNTPAHPDEIACISATGWRAVIRDVTAGRESRTWIAVDPAAATGPEDDSIATVHIVVGRLMAIGYCVPAELSDGQREARLWRIEPDEAGPDAPRPTLPLPMATPTEVLPLRTLVPRAPRSADLFGPPRPRPRWLAGRYVFAVDLERSDGPVWFSIEVADSEPVPTPQPSASVPAR